MSIGLAPRGIRRTGVSVGCGGSVRVVVAIMGVGTVMWVGVAGGGIELAASTTVGIH